MTPAERDRATLRKCRDLFLGPYPVTEIISPSVVSLRLPRGLKARSAVNTRNIKPIPTDYSGNTFISSHASNGTFLAVSEVLAHSFSSGSTFLTITWIGSSTEHIISLDDARGVPVVDAYATAHSL
jgi:hypothetical protein